MTTIKFEKGCVDNVPIKSLAQAFMDLGLELVARPDGTLLARRARPEQAPEKEDTHERSR